MERDIRLDLPLSLLKMHSEIEPTSQRPVPLQVIGRALRDWWDDWVNLAVINLLLALSWLTVILGPPATFGMVYVTNCLAHGQSVGPRGLLEGGRRYFMTSWLWMLLNLAVGVITGVSYLFYGSLSAAWAQFVQGGLLILAAAWLIVQFYALPYLMEQQEQRIGLALRNGLFTALAAPGYTLVVVGAAALVVALSVGTVALLFLGGPCLVAALGNRAVVERLETYGVRNREVNHKQE
jgi:uncharacterized membrane protein YesL